LAKKLNVDHFRGRHSSVAGSATGRTFETEEEKFDEAGASSLMASKKTWSKLNPLFLDTRVFNVGSNDYAPELSKPTGLEQYEKD